MAERIASVVIAGRITDLTRSKADGRMNAVLGKTEAGGYVLAEVVAVHTYKCAKRMGIVKETGKPCMCGAHDLLAKLLRTREQKLDDRENELDDRENELDDRERECDSREADLDNREQQLDEREE